MPVKEGYKFLYWEGSKYYPGDGGVMYAILIGGFLI